MNYITNNNYTNYNRDNYNNYNDRVHPFYKATLIKADIKKDILSIKYTNYIPAG